jgi:1-deoxy-D-xylulose-5-phosphate synthase
MVVMAPADEAECRRMLTTAYRIDGPTAVRYPRGSGTGTIPDKALDALPVGKGEIKRTTTQTSKKVAILAFGSMVAPCVQAGEMLDATVANMRFIKPLDHDLVRELAQTHDLLVSVEENALIGGAGSEIARSLEEQGLKTPLLRLGLPDAFIEHGDAPSLLAQHGLDSAGIVSTITKALS